MAEKTFAVVLGFKEAVGELTPERADLKLEFTGSKAAERRFAALKALRGYAHLTIDYHDAATGNWLSCE